jgi:hypothetical protein
MGNNSGDIILCIGQFPSIMVAFIHQNSKSIYAQIFFASSDSPKALRSPIYGGGSHN